MQLKDEHIHLKHEEAEMSIRNKHEEAEMNQQKTEVIRILKYFKNSKWRRREREFGYRIQKIFLTN